MCMWSTSQKKATKLDIHLFKTCRKCVTTNFTNDTHDFIKSECAEVIRATGCACRVEPTDNDNKLDLMIVCPDLETGLKGVDRRITNAIPAYIERRTTTHTHQQHQVI